MSATGQATAGLVRDWAHHALVGLARERARIDALNVFPVPDGDTGTNLYFTVESAATAVDACCESGETRVDAVARALAQGALMGARGNSGVILSQILRGCGEVLAEASEAVLDGAVLQRILARGSMLAYEAVAHPVEGTILTVMRGAADGADEAHREGRIDAIAVLQTAILRAQESLDRTPLLLEALRAAGVVDAGGQGLMVVLRGLLDALRGEAVPDVDLAHPLPVPLVEAPSGYIGPAFEVMYLLDAPAAAIPGLRSVLDGLGDSLVVVGGDELWNVHVHVDDAGAAVEAALAIGRPHRIRISTLRAMRGAEPAGRRLVAVSHGAGVADLLQQAGVVVVPAQAKVRPATSAFLEAVAECHAHEVVLLPSDKDSTGVAELAAEQSRAAGHRVAVIPTRSIVQTLAAVAMHEPDAAFDDDVIAMTRAAGATRYAAVTVASRTVLTTVGPCREGDILGLVDGDIAVIGADPLSVAREIIAGMVAVGGELITLVFGSEAEESMREGLAVWLRRTYPLIEVIAHDGGQPLWPVIVGVE